LTPRTLLLRRLLKRRSSEQLVHHGSKVYYWPKYSFGDNHGR
jgi:hypothetical protein